MQKYYKTEAGPAYEKLKKLVQSNDVDFIGVETPYVTMNTRIEKIKNSGELYAKLAKQAYGSQYVSDNLEKDLLGMFGPNWYFALNKPANLKAEGVESSLVEYRFGDTYAKLSELLTKISKAKTPENAKVIDPIVGLLGSTSALNSSVLELAKSSLTPDLYQEVATAADLRKKFDDDYLLRDKWMLSSMKSRTSKSGLLIVGQSHIGSMLKFANEFCDAHKTEKQPSTATSVR